jgi:hypothetical protein
MRAFMKLVAFELSKLIKSPAIVGFVIICIVANILFVLGTSQKEFIDYTNDVTEVTGGVYGAEYMEKFNTIPVSDDWRYEALAMSAKGTRDVFGEFKISEIQATLKNDDTKLSDMSKNILARKYEALEPVIMEKAERGDGDYVYFAEYTNYIHETVFGVGRLLMAESCIFFMLIMLWALGYEGMSKTSLVIFSTRTGRRIALHKVLSAFIIGTAFFILTYAVTYGLTFIVNDFSLVWEQNVSAQYHTSGARFLGVMPFITWSSMTIGEYLFAGLGVALLNAFVCGAFAIPFGLLIKNVYVAFCCAAGITFLNFVAMLLGEQTLNAVPFAWHLSLITPLAQMLNNLIWFTDGGTKMLIPHFEYLYPLICICLLGMAALVCAKRFHVKEIA